jgi:dimethylargininase
MTTKPAPGFGSRLVASPTGALRYALLVKPSVAVEQAKPLPGEPGAIYSRTIEQQAILRKTLAYFGVETIVFESIGDDPYELAPADAAVVFENGTLLMRPTAMSRRAEADRLAAELSTLDVPQIGRISPPGLLDGGDIVLAGSTAFVGVGRRGNALGRAEFASVAKAHGYDVVEVPLAPGAPSLRAVLSPVARDTLVVSAEQAALAPLPGFKTIVLDLGEQLAAGVLCISERHVIADLRYNTALGKMRKEGIVVEAIDLYDFAKIGVTPSMLALALKRD